MNDRRSLMRIIQKYDFALKELNLYLDTHPNCQRALAKYRKYLQLKNTAEDEFARKFGPINTEEVIDMNRWTWVDDPWPWERS